MNEAGTRHAAELARSLRDPSGYWGEMARGIDWHVAPRTMFDGQQGPYGRWFVDGVMNTAENCLDRHVAAGHGDRVAVIADSAMTGTVTHTTYARLTDRVARVAGALAALGVGRGDRVIVYMPMILEALIAMLACARLGAVHSVVFGGFAAPELATRIDDARPVAVVSASCGLEPGRIVAYKPLLDAAIGMAAHTPAACLIWQRPECAAAMQAGRDHDFAAAEAAAAPHPPVPVAATDPLYILYTSGTTGRPKGVVRDNGGHAVALRHSIDLIYGLTPGEVMWTASDVGWVVGHSYIVYAPLLAGLTTVLFEGKPVGTPDPGVFWRTAARHKVAALFTAPTALRAIRQADPELGLRAGCDLSRLRTLFLAGERCDPPTSRWIAAGLDVPVVDHWWQTETGWAITAGFRGLGLFAAKPGSGGRPSPGYDLAVLDDAGERILDEAVGNLALRLPLPPGCAPTLWGDDTRFASSYLADFPGWYRTGDAGRIDVAGDVWVMGRTDDIINVAGHRLSTGAMEEVLASHPDVAECAVVGAADPIKGQTPLGLFVLKAGANRDPAEVAAELVALVRARIGPVAAFRDARAVERLPKTRSGKILRATIRGLADGTNPVVPPTIDDPAVLDAVARVLHPPEES